MFSYVNAMCLGLMVINKVRVGLQEMPSIAWATKLCFYFGQVEKQERKGTASMSRMYILLNKQRSKRNLLRLEYGFTLPSELTESILEGSHQMDKIAPYCSQKSCSPILQGRVACQLA